MEYNFDDFKKDIFVLGNKMVDALNSYKISLNQTISDDMNYRIFETLGCKTFLLTNNVHNLSRLFKNGEHLVTYESVGDMVEKIKYYIKNENTLNQISQCGYEEVLKNHTYMSRARFLKEIIENY